MRQVAGGMECAECAHQLRVEVGQLDGVNATEASWNRRILTVRFRARNRVTLEELRAVVRRHHFSVREADVVVRGRVGRAASGELQLTVTGSGVVYSIAAAAAAPGATEALAAALARAAGERREVTLHGRIAGDEPSPGRAQLPGRQRGGAVGPADDRRLVRRCAARSARRRRGKPRPRSAATAGAGGAPPSSTRAICRMSSARSARPFAAASSARTCSLHASVRR